MAIPWADSIMEAPSCRVQPDGRAHGFESMDPANPTQPFHDGLYPGDDAFGVFDGLSDVFTFNEATDPTSFPSIWNFADASATTANSVVKQPTSSGTVNMPQGLHQPDSRAADELFLFLEQPDQSNERSAEFGEDVTVEAELSIPSSTFPDYFNQIDLFQPNKNTIGNELEPLDFQFTPIELDWPSLQKNEHTLERPTVAKKHSSHTNHSRWSYKKAKYQAEPNSFSSTESSGEPIHAESVPFACRNGVTRQSHGMRC